MDENQIMQVKIELFNELDLFITKACFQQLLDKELTPEKLRKKLLSKIKVFCDLEEFTEE